ncbi:unnamed protein product, partial [Adineta steineri]
GRFFDLYQRLQLDNTLCSLYHSSSAAAMKRHKRLHSSKYLKQQKVIIIKTEQQIQVIDSNDSESGEESEDVNIPQNKTNIITDASLIENIFDFLASDFIEVQSHLVIFL